MPLLNTHTRAHTHTHTHTPTHTHRLGPPAVCAACSTQVTEICMCVSRDFVSNKAVVATHRTTDCGGRGRGWRWLSCTTVGFLKLWLGRLACFLCSWSGRADDAFTTNFGGWTLSTRRFVSSRPSSWVIAIGMIIDEWLALILVRSDWEY